MKNLFKTSLAAAAAVALSAATAFAGAEVGEPAPEFTLTDTNGNEHSLADFEGKYVVLEWFNYGCPFVKKHYDADGNMQSLQEKYTGKDVVWLSINSTNPDNPNYQTSEQANELLAELEGKQTALLMDEDGTVGRAYDAQTTPHMFVINPEGNVIYAGAIDSVTSTDPADIEGATNYVAAALDAAMAGEEVATSQTQPYGCSVKYAKEKADAQPQG